MIKFALHYKYKLNLTLKIRNNIINYQYLINYNQITTAMGRLSHNFKKLKNPAIQTFYVHYPDLSILFIICPHCPICG